MFLVHEPTGLMLPGRCKATNLCGYCAKIAAIETTEMLWLDAMAQGSPAVWCVLTTRATWDADLFKSAFAHVLRALRRHVRAEYCSLLEFTTGYGPRSGGVRRPHFNVFWRNVPEDLLRRVVDEVWCRRVDALPRGQWVGRVDEDHGGMRGLTRYVGHHFQKESQAPPAEWSGQRFRASRGYFVASRALLRKEARASLQVGRDVHNGYSLPDGEWKVSHVRPRSAPSSRTPEVAGLVESGPEGVGLSLYPDPLQLS
jgi:hypothetical protein